MHKPWTINHKPQRSSPQEQKYKCMCSSSASAQLFCALTTLVQTPLEPTHNKQNKCQDAPPDVKFFLLMLAGTIYLSSLNKCWCTMHLWSNTNSSRSCCCKACGRTAAHLHGVCCVTRYDKAHTSPCPEGTPTPASSANLSSKRCAAAEASHRLCIQVTSLTFHATLTSRYACTS
jgi:hypothetical protein